MIINANSLHIPLASGVAQCVVASPPYYGLRDYGVPGQLGLEPTPEEYIANMVQVFREVWRVLRDDGTCFLNIGDSYFGSNMTGGNNGINAQGAYKKDRQFKRASGVQRATVCDTSGKELEGYQDHGCLCGNLCDVCRVVYQTYKSRNDGLLLSMLTASLSWTTPAHMELPSGHLPTLDLENQAAHIATAIQDRGLVRPLSGEPLRAVLVSTIDGFSPQLLDVCLQRASASLCLLCARSLVDYAQAFDYRTACTCDIVKRSGASSDHKTDISSLDLAYPYYTTKSHLKPKDLIGIPWMLAFALRADGWYLRSDIIWHKPNPMPESVTDRPTKSHEYVFLLTKSPRYYFDQEAVKEPSTYPDDDRKSRAATDQKRAPTEKVNGVRVPAGWKTGNGSHGTFHEDGRAQEVEYSGQTYPTRNLRTVWTIATQPTREAHFATYPEKLVEPCVLAGSKPGDIVLDPFSGSGTTGRVAIKNGRRYVGLELNWKYIDEISRKRIQVQIGTGL